MKRYLLMALIGAAPSVASLATSPANNEARLLRFPATNGHEVVFSFAGDLYSAPLSGGEARRLTAHVGNEIFARFSPEPWLSAPNTTAIPRSIPCLPRVANRCA